MSECEKKFIENKLLIACLNSFTTTYVYVLMCNIFGRVA